MFAPNHPVSQSITYALHCEYNHLLLVLETEEEEEITKDMQLWSVRLQRAKGQRVL